MAIQAGNLIDGKYEVLRLLGAGGFGTVYLAVQKDFDRQVAIKVLDSQHVDHETSARLVREAQVLSSLHHKNITMFYGHGELANSHYIVMEYAEGRPLQSLLYTKEPLPLDLLFDVFDQVAGALESAHAHGIIHRDLKPANIIIGTANDTTHVKVIDFGLAKILPSYGTSVQQLTNMGQAVGTAVYMSPEQCLGYQCDARSDIYALGCMLYQCITGVQPFLADSAVAVMYKHINEPAPVLSADAQSSPEEIALLRSFQSIVDQCLAKSPADRYQSAAQFQRDLARAKANKATTTNAIHVSSNQLSVGAPPISKSEPKRKPVALMSCIALVVVVVATLSAAALFPDQTMLLAFSTLSKPLSGHPQFEQLLDGCFAQIERSPIVAVSPIFLSVLNNIEHSSLNDVIATIHGAERSYKRLKSAGREEDASQLYQMLDKAVSKRANGSLLSKGQTNSDEWSPLVRAMCPFNQQYANGKINLMSNWLASYNNDLMLKGEHEKSFEYMSLQDPILRQNPHLRTMVFSGCATIARREIMLGKVQLAYRYLLQTVRLWGYGVKQSLISIPNNDTPAVATPIHTELYLMQTESAIAIHEGRHHELSREQWLKLGQTLRTALKMRDDDGPHPGIYMCVALADCITNDYEDAAHWMALAQEPIAHAPDARDALSTMAKQLNENIEGARHASASKE